MIQASSGGLDSGIIRGFGVAVVHKLVHLHAAKDRARVGGNRGLKPTLKCFVVADRERLQPFLL